MWILFIIVFSAVPPDVYSVLSTFRSEPACLSERDRIREEMAKAYPGDTDYEINCQLRVSTVNQEDTNGEGSRAF